MTSSKECLQQCWQIIGDRVDSAQLMHNHHTASEAEPSKVLRRAILEQCRELVAYDVSLQRVRLQDLHELMLGFL